MPAISRDTIATLVELPSLGAVTYQAQRLVEAIQKFKDREYPPQACKLRDLFLVIAERIVEELWDLYDPGDPLVLSEENAIRMRALGQTMHKLNACLRYIQTASVDHTPHEIQIAVTHLTHRYFPSANGTPLCITRPQWKYNFSFFNLVAHLRGFVRPQVLDPTGKMGAKTTEDLIQALWKAVHGADSEPPLQLAIFSFARLDTRDALLYPLLAHEIGHFLDYSHVVPLHMTARLRTLQNFSADDVDRVCAARGQPPPDASSNAALRSEASKLTAVCLRELLADSLATRMLGFGFFVAQAEFLKTVQSSDDRIVVKSGYPGVRFRLQTVFREMARVDSAANVRDFLVGRRDIHAHVTEPLMAYLDAWSDSLDIEHPNPTTPPGATTLPIEQVLAAEAVLRGMKDLSNVVESVIPDSACLALTDRFFERIALLKDRRPPQCEGDTESSFSEILSSAWAYQLLFGENAEIHYSTLDDQHGEYRETCDLVLKAVGALQVQDEGGDPRPTT